MRVAYVGPVPPYRGGISQHGARLTEALAEAGHDVVIHSWAAQYPRRLYPGEQRDPDAEPLEGARFSLRWWSPGGWWSAGRSARRADLLVFPWVTPFQAVAYRVMLAGASPTPGVVVVHNPVPHERRPFDELLTRLVLRRARGAVVHSKTGVPILSALAPSLRVVPVPQPPNLDVNASPLPPGPPYRLLFFGYVRPYKGLDVALEALALLLRRGAPVRMTVAGPFWEPVEAWRARIAELGIQDAVDLDPRYLADSEIDPLLSAHHLVLAPYRSATQSGIVPVAHAAGRPVVATEVGGLPERVREGVTGTLAAPGDPEAFAAAVERALADLPVLAAGAREDAAAWDDVVHAVIEAGS